MAPRDATAARERIVTWEDPMIGAAAGMGMSGIEYMGAIARGDLPPPPIAVLLGMGLVAVEPGRAVFDLDPAEHLYNPIGSVHGGILATILDSAMGCAVHATLPAGVGYTTLELKTNFVRRVTRDTGRIVCEGRVLHAGKTIAITEARVTDEAGTLYAHATGTCLILRPKG